MLPLIYVSASGYLEEKSEILFVDHDLNTDAKKSSFRAVKNMRSQREIRKHTEQQAAGGQSQQKRATESDLHRLQILSEQMQNIKCVFDSP